MGELERKLSHLCNRIPLLFMKLEKPGLIKKELEHILAVLGKYKISNNDYHDLLRLVTSIEEILCKITVVPTYDNTRYDVLLHPLMTKLTSYKTKYVNRRRRSLVNAFDTNDQDPVINNDFYVHSRRGDEFLFGFGVQRNYYKAYSSYTEGTRGDDCVNKFMIGYMYQQGLGREDDLPMAIYWYKEAANSNNSDAMNSLGEIFQYGDEKFGIEKSPRISIQYYHMAAKEGEHAGAMTNLGFMLETGLITGLDYWSAAEWYCKAAERGSLKAMNNLGCLFYNGHVDGSPDYYRAIDYFSKAAQLGYPSSYCNLGLCYETGNGVEVNKKMAKNLYKAGIRENHPQSFVHLASLYLAEKKEDNAVRLLKIASDIGDCDAKYTLGHLYYNRNTSESKKLSHSLLEEAALNGHIGAKEFFLKNFGCGTDQALGHLAI